MASQPHGISPAGGKTTTPSTPSQSNPAKDDVVNEKHWGTTQKYMTEEEAWADPNHNALTGERSDQQVQRPQGTVTGGVQNKGQGPASATAGERIGDAGESVSAEKHWGTTQKYTS
ncbi:hypothetical protein HDV00_010897 [Rhizophlyctis rosea]|nr:hypothetical protein HDV00_010897 [Rhizophlyctis rosea]